MQEYYCAQDEGETTLKSQGRIKEQYSMTSGCPTLKVLRIVEEAPGDTTSSS